MKQIIKGKKYTLRELSYNKAKLIIQLCLDTNLSNIIEDFELLDMEKTASNLIDYVEKRTKKSFDDVIMII